tara:strand:+ start:332 stop:1030 length:699 start_codon:yes stop_codon:yes gene_type:complete
MTSCGSKDSNDEIKLSSLIQPNFSFTYDLIECELNKNSSLLDLEFFFSKNIDKYKAITDGKIRLSILFPENKINVSGFIIAIKSNTDYGNLESFISQIQRDQFNDIALCKFITNQNKGFNILEYKNNSNLDYEFVEILTCQYKEGYNYGSFEITINRFLNYIQKLDIPYSLNYVNKSKNNEFIWINSFHNNDYKQILIDSWVMENEAIEIKDEFIENASCIESDTFKSYHLL